MGRDKGLIELNGRALIEYVIEALSGTVASISIIANSDEYRRFGLPVLPDTNRGIGPFEAIRTALANSNTENVVLCACDMPFVTRELLQYLLENIDGNEVVVPQDESGMLEPLCAIYSRTALGPLTELIAAGRRKVSDLFARVQTRIIPFDDLRNLSGARHFFKNINTPADLESASQILRLIPGDTIE